LLLSRILDYRRFGDEMGHGLKLWGKYFNYPKIEFEDWSAYTPEMHEYCLQDVRLTVKVHKKVMDEFQALYRSEPQIATYIAVEHAVARFCGEANLHGWPFDKEAAVVLETALQAEMQKAYDALSSQLGKKCVAKDKENGEVQVKTPKYTKEGFYHSHTASWFGVQTVEGLLDDWERPINGPYCRVEFPDLDLDSHADVKIFLFRNGWEPIEWNYKKDPETGFKTKEKSSPKITEESLELLGEQGALYPKFLTAKSRHSILTTWIKNTTEKGMLHGDQFTIGTPSMRATHSIIVNVPSSDSPWGKEMRSLFGCLPGWKLIGCDSSGNQARGLAHYLKDAEFIDTLVNGDIHTYNAKLIGQSLIAMKEDWDEYIIKHDKAQLPKRLINFLDKKGVSKLEYMRSNNRPSTAKTRAKAIAAAKRAVAKRILYAFLFGAGGDKLWSYIYGVGDKEKGNKFKTLFTKAVPGFSALIEKLSKIYGSTKKFGDGYIPSVAGNRIYVDSFHKLLVYLLQSMEKVTCGAACMLAMERLEAAGIPYVPCIMMHDEIDFMVPEQFAKQAAEIGKQAFVDGPKLFGVEIMDGSGKIGDNWYDVH
jgi:hypothetical protein